MCSIIKVCTRNTYTHTFISSRSIPQYTQLLVACCVHVMYYAYALQAIFNSQNENQIKLLLQHLQTSAIGSCRESLNEQENYFTDYF